MIYPVVLPQPSSAAVCLSLHMHAARHRLKSGAGGGGCSEKGHNPRCDCLLVLHCIVSVRPRFGCALLTIAYNCGVYFSTAELLPILCLVGGIRGKVGGGWGGGGGSVLT